MLNDEANENDVAWSYAAMIYDYNQNVQMGNIVLHPCTYMHNYRKVDTEKNIVDVIICDEAHRLNDKSGMFHNLGENQIKEIINASLCSVFFIDDERVIIRTKLEKPSKIKGLALI